MENKERNTFPCRLQEIIDTFCEGKNRVCARMTGTNEANIRGYLNGTVPKLPFLERCVRTFDIDARWLLTSEGAMRCEGSAEAVPSKPQPQESPDWETRQLLPTSRHFLLYPEEEGYSYEIIDALIVCSKTKGGDVMYRSFGVRMTTMSLREGITLGQQRDSILSDFLDARTHEKMVSHLKKSSLFSRQEALHEIHLDFSQTDVKISPVVRQILSETE